jgi:hypothetical protein
MLILKMFCTNYTSVFVIFLSPVASGGIQTLDHGIMGQYSYLCATHRYLRKVDCSHMLVCETSTSTKLSFFLSFFLSLTLSLSHFPFFLFPFPLSLSFFLSFSPFSLSFFSSRTFSLSFLFLFLFFSLSYCQIIYEYGL